MSDDCTVSNAHEHANAAAALPMAITPMQQLRDDCRALDVELDELLGHISASRTKLLLLEEKKATRAIAREQEQLNELEALHARHQQLLLVAAEPAPPAEDVEMRSRGASMQDDSAPSTAPTTDSARTVQTLLQRWNASMAVAPRGHAELDKIRATYCKLVADWGDAGDAARMQAYEHVTVCMVGLTGAGKSKLINALVGLPLMPSSQAGLVNRSVSFCPVEVSYGTGHQGKLTLDIILPTPGEIQDYITELTTDSGTALTQVEKESNRLELAGLQALLAAATELQNSQAPEDHQEYPVKRFTFAHSDAGAKEASVIIHHLAESPMGAGGWKRFGDAATYIECVRVELDGTQLSPSGLSPAVRLVDLPGLRDPIRKRSDVAAAYFARADNQFAVVIPSERPDLQGFSELMDTLQAGRGLLTSTVFVLSKHDDVALEKMRTDDEWTLALRATEESVLHQLHGELLKVAADAAPADSSSIAALSKEVPVCSTAAETFILGCRQPKNELPLRLAGVVELAATLNARATSFVERKVAQLQAQMIGLVKWGRIRTDMAGAAAAPSAAPAAALLPAPAAASPLSTDLDPLLKDAEAQVNDAVATFNAAIVAAFADPVCGTDLAAFKNEWLQPYRKGRGKHAQLNYHLRSHQSLWCTKLLSRAHHSCALSWSCLFEKLLATCTQLTQALYSDVGATPFDSALRPDLDQHIESFKSALEEKRAELWERAWHSAPRERLFPDGKISQYQSDGLGATVRMVDKLEARLPEAFDAVYTKLMETSSALLQDVRKLAITMVDTKQQRHQSYHAMLKEAQIMAAADPSAEKAAADSIAALVEWLDNLCIDIAGSTQSEGIPDAPLYIEDLSQLRSLADAPDKLASLANFVRVSTENPFLAPPQLELVLRHDGVPKLVHQMYKRFYLSELDYMADGFYFVSWKSAGSAGLQPLEAMCVADQADLKYTAAAPSGVQLVDILLFNSAKDKALADLVEKMKGEINAYWQQSPASGRLIAKWLAEFVARQLPVPAAPADVKDVHAYIVQRCDAVSLAARQPNTRVVHIGDLLGKDFGGICRHRTLLFKYLADRLRTDNCIPLRCRVTFGSINDERDPHAWNTVMIPTPHVVDVMLNPGELMSAGHAKAFAQYMRGFPKRPSEGSIGGVSQGAKAAVPTFKLKQLSPRSCGAEPVKGGQALLCKIEAKKPGSDEYTMVALKVYTRAPIIAAARRFANAHRTTGADEEEPHVLATLMHHPQLVRLYAVVSVKPADLQTLFPKLTAADMDPDNRQTAKLSAILCQWEDGLSLDRFIQHFSQLEAVPMATPASSRQRVLVFCPAVFVSIAMQLSHLLLFLEQAGVVHRDWTPDNIMVRVEDDDVHCTLVDFGLARITQQGELLTSHHNFGKAPYMAPELQDTAPGAALTLAQPHALDVYAFGKTLLYMASGGMAVDKDHYKERLNATQCPPLKRLIDQCCGIAANRPVPLEIITHVEAIAGWFQARQEARFKKQPAP